MPFDTKDTKTYRSDVQTRGQTLSVSERDALLRKYLPTELPSQRQRPVKKASQRQYSGHKRRIRPFLRHLIHLIIHLSISLVFSFYLRARQIFRALVQKYLSIRHYHHRTPAYIQKDIASLSRLPQHLSVLLKYYPESDADGSGLETIIDEVAELSAWSTAAGIPVLSIYEKSGILKSYMSAVQELVNQKLVSYFGPAPSTPSLRVWAPNLPPLESESNSAQIVIGATDGDVDEHDSSRKSHLDLLLLSASDGRDTLVDLTRTLTEMSQSKKLKPKDITTALVTTEIHATTTLPAREEAIISSDAVFDHDRVEHKPLSRLEKTSSEAATSEPDLLIVFAPYLKLDGYPPWQVRLTEIFCVGDTGRDVSRQGRTRVEYQAFLRGLWNYAGAHMRFGS